MHPDKFKRTPGANLFDNPDYRSRLFLADGGVYDNLGLETVWGRYDNMLVSDGGKPFEFEADGLLAVCIQHEMDHLDGKLFVDYLSQLKQTRIRKKLEKEQRLAG